ncbi:MAG: LamG-like jellyroll fold domain-containing protein, partial [Patescibacteria group bacterium]
SLVTKDLDIYPIWKGTTIRLASLHLFCATRLHEPTYPMYCVGKEPTGHHGVLVSYDQGTTWQDYAIITDPADVLSMVWSVSGAREITPDGYLIGIYTNQVNAPANASAVRFFRVKVKDPSDPNLDSYWPQDETSGTIVNDLIGSHNGTTTASIVDGKSGKARNFVSDAWNTNTKIQFPSFSANFDTGAGFTVEAWIKKDSSTAGHEHRVIGNRYVYSDANGWQLTFNSFEKIDFSVQSAGVPSTNLRSTYDLDTNTWYHIAGVYDKGTLKLYINGELNNTVSGAGYSPSNRELTIGGQPDSPNYGFDGLIDEVRIYSSALSAETIQQHFLDSISADLNHDGKIDAGDYTIFVSDFNKTGNPGWIRADIDKNGKVDIFDYNILVENFGK